MAATGLLFLLALVLINLFKFKVICPPHSSTSRGFGVLGFWDLANDSSN